MARESLYSEQVAIELCNRIADGETLQSICSDPTMPNRGTVWKWRSEHEDFERMYQQARKFGADAIADGILQVARDSHGKQAAEVAAARLECDAAKWLAAKFRPDIYGDQLTVGGTIEINARHMAAILHLAEPEGELGRLAMDNARDNILPAIGPSSAVQALLLAPRETVDPFS